MSLELHLHPLASYCWKVLLALYETHTPFEPVLVELGDQQSAAEFKRLWPLGKFPVLKDTARNAIVPESTIIVEYLTQHYPAAAGLIPEDAEHGREVRLWDRFFDLYVHDPMQKIVADRLRPPTERDAYGVARSRDQLRLSYGILEERLRGRTFAVGNTFTLADCAAAPALYYSDRLVPVIDYPSIRAYLDRLIAGPAFARVLLEAQPYFARFPG